MSWRQMLHATLALTLALASIAHFGGAIAATDKNSQPIPCEAIDSVGRAKMSPDGTITLQLRSLWPTRLPKLSSFLHLTIRNTPISNAISPELSLAKPSQCCRGAD